jgi:hypothetical protein
VSRGAGLAQEVEDAVVLGQVDVQVDLGTTVVQVRRHRVPHRPAGDDGDAELEPGRRQVRAPRVAVEVALAGALRGAERDRLDVGVAQCDGRVRHVGDGRDEVEGRVRAGEGDLAPTTDEQTVEMVQLELLAVDQDVAGLADVDDAELAALQVGVDPEDLGPGGEVELAASGDRATDDQAVVVGVDGMHLTGLEQVLNEEVLAQVRRVGCLHALRRCRIPDLDHADSSFCELRSSM